MAVILNPYVCEETYYSQRVLNMREHSNMQSPDTAHILNQYIPGRAVPLAFSELVGPSFGPNFFLTAKAEL